MSNRDGKGAKPNKKHTISRAKTKCPFCKTTLSKCGDHGPGHDHHRFCQTCNWSNF